MASGFSSILKITDLDDFITPSQECIKPVTLPEKGKVRSRGLIQIEGVSSTSDFKLTEPPKYEKAKITLNDCLACSGCITTAEVVLVNQQSIEELIRIIKENEARPADEKLCIVLSLSLQSVISLTAKYSLSPQDCIEKIIGYFKKLGIQYAFDTNFARCFSLIEAQKEFLIRHQKRDSDPTALPMLASACPGWICYAEKTHGSYILPHLSTTRSPQQVMGALVKDFWAPKKDLKPSQVYHVTLMPCFDKKLEASRNEFLAANSDSREVDCVITSVELDQHIEREAIDFKSLEGSPLDTELSLGPSLMSHEGSGSGGYAHHIFCHAARELFGVENRPLDWKVLRNNDFQEISLDVEGKPVLRFAFAYGFRNIQNIVQKIKRKKCPYDYIEVMACPSGCLNGGAQARPTNEETNKDLLKRLQSMYSELPTHNPNEDLRIQELYCEWLEGIQSPKVKEKLHTTYKQVEQMTDALAIKW